MKGCLIKLWKIVLYTLGGITALVLLAIILSLFAKPKATQSPGATPVAAKQAVAIAQTSTSTAVPPTKTPTAGPSPTSPPPTSTPQPTPTPLPTDTPLPTNTPTKTSTATNTPLPTNTPVPTPTPSFKDKIAAVIDKRNRDVQPAFTVDAALDVINVQWALNDNFSNDWIKKGALMEAAKLLRVIHESGLNYQMINLTGTFELVDSFGNSKESPVMWIEMSRATMDKINWTDEGFVNFVLYQRLPEIADRLKYHPALEK